MSNLKYFLVVCVSALFLHISPADSVFLQKLAQKLSLYNQKFPQEKVYLQLNKSVFKPKEHLWFKAYVVESTTHLPSSLSADLTIKLIDEDGADVFKKRFKIKKGIVTKDFRIPKSLEKGMYSLVAYTNWMQNGAAEDVFKQDLFVVNSALPAFFIQADLSDSLYQPKVEVGVKIRIGSQDGAPVKNLEFEFAAKMGDKIFKQGKQKTDREGVALIQVTLPEDLMQHPVTLNIKAKHKKKVETRTIIIPTPDSFVNLEFFPEGSNLIDGIKTNIAFKAVDRYGYPFDFKGEVINQKEKVVSKIKTYHDGVGVFSLTPNTGDAYRVRITNPTGIGKMFDLPNSSRNGMALSVEEVTRDFITILVRAVGRTEGEKTVWVGQVRGNIYWSEDVSMRDSIIVKIPTKKFPVGVAQLTVFDSAGVPAAERLLFVNQHKIMHIDVTTDKIEYDTKEMVGLTIFVDDENRMPIPANLCISIQSANRSYLDTTPNIWSTLFLTSELDGKIDHPNFYFETSPEADAALDQLLVSQKLRRFSWKKIVEMDENQGLAYVSAGAVSGEVYHIDGKPAENARVWLKNTAGKTLETQTDSDGKFQFFSDGSTDLDVQVIKAKTEGGSEKVKIIQDETFAQKVNKFCVLGVEQKIFNDVRLDKYKYPQNWENAAAVANAKMVDKYFWSTEKATVQDDKIPVWKQVISSVGVLEAVRMIKSYSIRGTGIFFRGASSINNPRGALIVLDGMKLGYDYRTLNSINPNDIDDIKIHLSTLEIMRFDSFAFDGVIEVTTKSGRNKGIGRTERSRFTMKHPFWMPDIHVDNTGEVGFNYYNPDKTLSIMGIMEGISNDGKPGRAVFRYSIHEEK